MWGGGLGLAQPVLGDVGDGVEVEGGGGVAAVMAVVAGGVAVAGVADRAGGDLRAGGDFGFWILLEFGNCCCMRKNQEAVLAIVVFVPDFPT